VGDERDSPKARLRRALDARREAIASDDIARASHAICDRVGMLEQVRSAAVIVLYAARRSEIVPRSLEAIVEGRQAKTLYYPRVEGDDLSFRRATFADLAPGRFGIPEPPPGAPALSPEMARGVVVVPGLGFDRAGGRIGTGKGYYDRTLSRFPGLLRIGLAMDDFVVDRLPTDPWDVPMHLVVTEHDLLFADLVGGASPGDLPWR
jgi:5-formyltetrahydrofolate cyclo-ligase